MGIINHKDYTYESQETLDKVADSLCVERPITYLFSSLSSAIATFLAKNYSLTSAVQEAKEYIKQAGERSVEEIKNENKKIRT